MSRNLPLPAAGHVAQDWFSLPALPILVEPRCLFDGPEGRAPDGTECDRLVCQHLSSTEQLSYLNAIKKMIQPGSPNGDKIPMGFVGRTSKKMLLQRFRVALHPQRALSRKALILIAILCVLAFLASYCFILQPASHPTSEDLGNSQVIPGPAETSFILHESDGTYSLFIDGIMRDILTAAEIMTEPYCTYEIVEIGG